MADTGLKRQTWYHIKYLFVNTILTQHSYWPHLALYKKISSTKCDVQV